MDAKAVNDLPIEEVLRDKTWQQCRKNCIGRWKTNYQSNINFMKAYLEVYEYCPEAIRRVLHLLSNLEKAGYLKVQIPTREFKEELEVRWNQLLSEDA